MNKFCLHILSLRAQRAWQSPAGTRITGDCFVVALLAMTCILLFSCSSYAASPQRIVSLKPNITELLFAVGAGDQVVGVTTWCDKPEAAKKITKVADYIKPNIEKILALKPDLVISSEENSIKLPMKTLEASGVKLLYLSFKTVDDTLRSLIKLAEATGHEKEGKLLVSSIEKNIKDVKAAATTANKPKVLLIVGRRPLIAAGPVTFLGELIDIAGGENIVVGKMPYPNISVESIIARNPDVVIDLSMGTEDTDQKMALRGEWKNYDISAIKNDRLYSLNIADFRAGPELSEQLKKLKSILNKTSLP